MAASCRRQAKRWTLQRSNCEERSEADTSQSRKLTEEKQRTSPSDVDLGKQTASVSIKPDGIGNTLVFLISCLDQRNGSRAFVPSARRFLRLKLWGVLTFVVGRRFCQRRFDGSRLPSATCLSPPVARLAKWLTFPIHFGVREWAEYCRYCSGGVRK